MPLDEITSGRLVVLVVLLLVSVSLALSWVVALSRASARGETRWWVAIALTGFPAYLYLLRDWLRERRQRP